MLLLSLVMTQALYSEPLRPQFHFTAEKGWLNDPNGLVYHEGEYHLFFQHNPHGTQWGNMTWGHAVSPDLVHWKQLPNAIEPDELGTIYSGSAIVDPRDDSGLGADLIAFYTAAGGKNEASKGKPFTQCLAFSKDKGRTWTKLGKPIIPHIVHENRDPKVVWDPDSKQWVMALYLDGEEFAFFTSKNLRDWTEQQRFSMPGVAECPDLFSIPVQGTKERKWVFTGANGRYWVGSFDGKLFRPESSPRQVEFGAHNYAVQTYDNAPEGRRIQIGWMNGGSFEGMPFNQQMTFPCELTLRKASDGLRLYRYPVKEIEKLWGAEQALSSERTKATDLVDISLDFAARETRTKLKVNQHEVVYDPITHVVTALGRSAPLAPEKGRIQLRVLVDRMSVELFGNGGRISMSTCSSPVAEPSISVETPEPKTMRAVFRPLASAWKS